MSSPPVGQTIADNGKGIAVIHHANGILLRLHPLSVSVCRHGHFGAFLILFIGSARYGYRTDNTATFDDRYGTATGHDPAIARNHQALKPALPGNARQILGRLLKAGRRVCFIESDFHRDRTRLVHAPKRDHATALVDDYSSYGNVELRCLAVCIAHHLNRLFSWDRSEEHTSE